jgi:SAM-dependent methyltransferase
MTLGATARRVAATVRRRAGDVRPRADSLVLAAGVDEFAETTLHGWADVKTGAPPIPVGVFINDFEAVRAWAVEPAKDRLGEGEMRVFRLAIRDLWKYCKTTDRITVRVGGTPVPIAGRGLSIQVPADGQYSLRQLKGLLDSGHVFGQHGRIQLSKTLDVTWQRTVMGVYSQVREIVADEFGYDVFLCYGTLLGAVRENGFIGHDLDFDAAFVSKHADGQPAARELQQMAFKLIDAGLDVACMRNALHIHSLDAPTAQVDLFHLYFDRAGRLSFPFGVAGSTQVTTADWRGTRPIELAGGHALLPANAEQMAEFIYGASWRTPKPGFNWKRDRTTRSRAGILPLDYGIEVHWDNFYARHPSPGPSSFARAIAARPDRPATVLELGCGDGRDTNAFAEPGQRAFGIDRSRIGLRHAAQNGELLGIADRVSYHSCDFGDEDALREVLARLLERVGGQPVLVYARFLFTALEPATEQLVLAALRDCARTGDLLAIELRSVADETRAKAYANRFRRFHDGPTVLHRLSDRFGFEVVDTESGTGLSPFESEDPDVLRVVARFDADLAARAERRTEDEVGFET